MKLTEVSKQLQKVQKGKYVEILDEFMKSDMRVARVDEYAPATFNCCRRNLQDIIQRKHYIGVKCHVQQGEIYLVKYD